MTAPAYAPPKASPNGNRPPLNVDGIPIELQDLRQWVLWKYETGRDGKTTKVPYQPSGNKASSINPATWVDFDTALRAYNASGNFSGIGIAIARGLACVDIDHCLDTNGIPNALALRIVAGLQTYVEVSPGGDGLHFIFLGHLPGKDIPKNKTGVEMYDGERYLTVTGLHLEGTPATVEQRTQEVIEFYDEVQEMLEPPNPLAALVVPAVDVAGRDPSAVEWLTYKFIECGELVLLTAPGGSLKSLLMLVWAVCVAAGIHFLTLADGTGGRLTKAARVLWINTDNGLPTHENRLSAILRTLGLSDVPLFSITTTDFDLKEPEHIRNIYLLADDLAADVIVIDTLSGALTGVNENSAEEMSGPAAHLRALASNGRTVIGIHHPPKSDSDGSRGSSVLPNKVDRVFSVARDKDLLTVKPQKVRNSPSPAFTAIAALSVDLATDALLGVNFFDGTGAQQLAELQQAKERILDALAAGPLNTRSVYKSAKMRKDVVGKALSDLVVTRQITVTSGPKNSKVYELL